MDRKIRGYAIKYQVFATPKFKTLWVYLAKPFHVEELVVRLQALIRRHKGENIGLLKQSQLTFDEERQTVIDENGQLFELTGTEF